MNIIEKINTGVIEMTRVQNGHFSINQFVAITEDPACVSDDELDHLTVCTQCRSAISSFSAFTHSQLSLLKQGHRTPLSTSQADISWPNSKKEQTAVLDQLLIREAGQATDRNDRDENNNKSINNVSSLDFRKKSFFYSHSMAWASAACICLSLLVGTWFSQQNTTGDLAIYQDPLGLHIEKKLVGLGFFEEVNITRRAIAVTTLEKTDDQMLMLSWSKFNNDNPEYDVTIVNHLNESIFNSKIRGGHVKFPIHLLSIGEHYQWTILHVSDKSRVELRGGFVWQG